MAKVPTDLFGLGKLQASQAVDKYKEELMS